MANFDLIQVGEFVIKNGAKAVLLVWVFMLQMQVSDIQEDYKDCMNDRVNDSQRNYPQHTPVAVLPDPIKVKRKS
jgi:hypothetical protein